MYVTRAIYILQNNRFFSQNRFSIALEPHTCEEHEPHTPFGRVSPQSCSPFSASLYTFSLTAHAYLNTQKYGLFCSLGYLWHGWARDSITAWAILRASQWTIRKRVNKILTNILGSSKRDFRFLLGIKFSRQTEINKLYFGTSFVFKHHILRLLRKERLNHSKFIWEFNQH